MKTEKHSDKSWKNQFLPYAMDYLDQVELERQTYAHRIEVDQREMETIMGISQISTWRDELHRRLFYEIRADIYGKKHPSRHIIRYPADWLEALKERFAPSWVRDRWPVRFIEISASLNEIYPDVRPAIPDKHPVMKFAVMKKEDRPVW